MTTQPRRLILRPGLRVVPAGTDQLRVGMHGPHRTRLPADAVTADVLDRLRHRRGFAAEESAEVEEVLDRLAFHGCLAEHQVTAPRRPPTTVAVLADPNPHTEAVSPVVTAALGAAGLTATSALETAPVALVWRHGEVVREQLDPLVRRDQPHLLVRLVDGGVLLGPFVQPGRTACVRCIDAHRAERDPHHVAVVTRYALAAGAIRDDGVADPDQPLLTAYAAAWAARALGTHLAGGRPAGWSATRFVEPTGPDEPERRWPIHAACGCTW